MGVSLPSSSEDQALACVSSPWEGEEGDVEAEARIRVGWSNKLPNRQWLVPTHLSPPLPVPSLSATGGKSPVEFTALETQKVRRILLK